MSVKEGGLVKERCTAGVSGMCPGKFAFNKYGKKKLGEQKLTGRSKLATKHMIP